MVGGKCEIRIVRSCGFTATGEGVVNEERGYTYGGWGWGRGIDESIVSYLSLSLVQYPRAGGEARDMHHLQYYEKNSRHDG